MMKPTLNEMVHAPNENGSILEELSAIQYTNVSGSESNLLDARVSDRCAESLVVHRQVEGSYI